MALIVGVSCALLPLAEPAGTTVKVLVLFIVFYMFGLASLRTSRTSLSAVCSWTPLRWLGSMSYSYYLLHGLVLKGGFLMLSHILPPTGQQLAMHWMLLLPMLAITLPPSAALFLAIERPFSLAPGARHVVALPRVIPVNSIGSAGSHGAIQNVGSEERR